MQKQQGDDEAMAMMFHLVLNCNLSLFARISDKKERLS